MGGNGDSAALARILVVEDEWVAVPLEAALEQLGYAVVGMVTSGEDAVEKARALRPDLILMDISLGGVIDGVDAAAIIRAERDVPVIYLTGRSDPETLRRATNTAPLGYLLKPFGAGELRCTIQVALHQHEVNAELERRDVERLRQLEIANQELASFSYSVAHELRSPLRGISGFSEILIGDHGANLGTEEVDLLTRIRKSAKRMAQLIDDLLTIARLARTPFVVSRSVDLSKLARAVAADLTVARPDRRGDFRVQEDVRVEGDEHLLRIALEHLLKNAWKYTSGAPGAWIEFGKQERDGEDIYFVRDNGPGFDMKYATKVFGDFQRLDASDEFDGTGAGLGIVRRIVERHGGRIWAETGVQQGAAFYFSLAAPTDVAIRLSRSA